MINSVLLSIKYGLIAAAINIPVAIVVEYCLSRFVFKGKIIIEGLINLPLVMPPVTTGYLLLIILGRNGFIGSILYSVFGLRIAFSGAAAVIAAMVVSFPLIARSIKISMEMLDPYLENAALTLGAGRISIFFRITLPLIMPGLLSGAVIGFARSLGEFGATMTFAGNIEGISRTIPLSVYSFLQIPGRENDAAKLVTVSVVISFAAIFLSSLLNKKEKSYGS